VAIDITNPANISVKKIVDFVFPERLYSGGFVGDNSKVIIDWRRVDTTITETCEKQSNAWYLRSDVFFGAANASGPAAASSGPSTGMGGSMARFTIVNNYMYSVDRHSLKSISISNPSDPVVAGEMNAGWDIETIYPFKNKLFLGSMGGMFIFDITDPAHPVSQGNFIHARACDPVIADDNYAFVTLRAGTSCGPTTNELQVINVQNLQSPSLVKTYAMTGPQGLSKDDQILFICDGTAGLKVYNAADVQNLQLLKTLSGMEPVDVIAYAHRAMVVAKDGLYQYDYTDVSNIRLLSKITISK
jgi:hypothetical protein